MKLINGDLEFELMEVPTENFLLTQEEPYPMKHIIYSASTLPSNSYGSLHFKEQEYNTYMYKSIRINDKFYGFKLIE